MAGLAQVNELNALMQTKTSSAVVPAAPGKPAGDNQDSDYGS